jgi:predicted nucleic acid-binding protein
VAGNGRGTGVGLLLPSDTAGPSPAAHQRLGPGPVWESAADDREAWSAYEAFLSDDRIAFQANEPVGAEPLWKELAARGTASLKLWMDAYLAAFALAGRYSMVITDAAFRQFRGLDLLILGQS